MQAKAKTKGAFILGGRAGQDPPKSKAASLFFHL